MGNEWGCGAMNHLYYGDNLNVLRDLPGDHVDLIYLDPPFNSNAGYNQLFKAPDGSGSTAQIEAFNDTWHWGDAAEDAFQAVRRSPNAAADNSAGEPRWRPRRYWRRHLKTSKAPHA